MSPCLEPPRVLDRACKRTLPPVSSFWCWARGLGTCSAEKGAGMRPIGQLASRFVIKGAWRAPARIGPRVPGVPCQAAPSRLAAS